MAHPATSLLTLTSSDLWNIAGALKATLRQESNHRRIQRFLSDYDVDFTMLGGLLLHLLPQTPPYEVVVDRTEWYFGETAVNILMVGIVQEGMTFPIAWRTLSSEGSSSAEAQTEILEHFLEVVEPDSIEVPAADREFISVPWMKRLEDLVFSFAIRIRLDRRIGKAPDGPSLPARMYARAVGPENERALKRTRYLSGTEKEPFVSVRIVIRRIGDEDAEDPFLISATRGIDPGKATALYKKRWEILALLAALKSLGLGPQETHLTEPDKTERLIGLLSLAFAWARLVGEVCAERQGPRSTKSHGRRERSLFRYGLDRLHNILSTLEPQDQAFFQCLAGLRGPRVFSIAGVRDQP